MSGYNFTLEHRCPQCGAPVQLQETDRIFSCPFCRVRLYIHFPRYGSYRLDCPKPAAGSRFYVPYWRFKGMQFGWRSQKIRHKLIDYSMRACNHARLPYSLIFRAEVFKLRFVEPGTDDLHVPVHIELEESLGKHEQLSAGELGLSLDPSVYEMLRTPGDSKGGKYQSYIGEVRSLIYAPFYRKNGGIYDGLTDSRLDSACEFSDIVQETSQDRRCGFRFFSTLCPNCGWDMECESDSLILLCSRCNAAWAVADNGLESVPFVFYSAEKNADLWIPFWSLEVDCEGIDLESYADFIRLTNFPRAVLPWMENQEFRFWVPAFKINPPQFLSLGTHMIVKQKKREFSDIVPDATFYPVTLPAAEGFQSAPFVLGVNGYSRKRLLPSVLEAEFSLKSKELVFVPFVSRGTEYVQPQMNFGLHKNSLKWGRRI